MNSSCHWKEAQRRMLSWDSQLASQFPPKCLQTEKEGLQLLCICWSPRTGALGLHSPASPTPVPPQLSLWHGCKDFCWALGSVIRCVVILETLLTQRYACTGLHQIKASRAWLCVPTRCALSAKFDSKNSQPQKNQAQTIYPPLPSFFQSQRQDTLINPGNLSHRGCGCVE